MKSLGIDAVDSGFEFAVGRLPGPDGRATAEWLESLGSTPAVAVAEESALHFGTAAEQRRFLLPRDVCETFWESVSLQASKVRRGGRPLTQSELAYHFLSHLVDELPGVAADHERLVVAVPSPFIDGSERAEEQLGILLGIVGDLELRLAGVVDSAVAAILDPEGPPPMRGHALVIDLGLHAATLTLVEVGASLVRRSFARNPGAGWLALVNLARRTLADRFLRATSFDITADRRTEQEFYDQTLAALSAFATDNESVIRISAGGRERVMQIARDAVVADLAGLADTVIQGARDLLARAERELPAVRVYLSHRARQLCGLRTALQGRGVITVATLGPGAAARGAARLALHRALPAQLEEVPVETAVLLPNGADDPAAAVQTAFSLLRQGRSRHPAPTHVVFDGMAHALPAHGARVALGAPAGDAFLALPLVPAAVGPCELLIEPAGAEWRVAVLVGGVRVPVAGGEGTLAAGDVLDVHGAPGMARLLFVRVQG